MGAWYSGESNDFIKTTGECLCLGGEVGGEKGTAADEKAGDGEDGGEVQLIRSSLSAADS